jgi:hypothetical protein
MKEASDQGANGMPRPEIEEFAKVLVEWVRDAAIRSSDRTLRPDSPSPVATRWREAAREETHEAFAKALIPDIVDDTVFYLLQAIDQEVLQLSFRASNGRRVDLAAEGLGELSGSYMGSDGWRRTYAKERFVDYCSDLTLDQGKPETP